MKSRKIFSKGNRKLPTDIAIFNLPSRITCPGATEECKQYCYAKKAERMYKGALPFRYKNLELTKTAQFVDTAVEQLSRMHKLRAVRMHESGDFYNQSYLDKWVTIAKKFPDVIFTAYTKSLHLDFSKMQRLKNVVLFASVDDTTKAHMLKKNKLKSKAIVIESTATEAPKGYFLCPGSCKKCPHCYTAKAGNVAFRKH